MEVEVQIRLLRTDDLREILQTEFVAVFELAVVFRLLLNGIIRQVDEHISDVFKGVLATTRANVSILVAVPLQTPVDAGKKAEASEVELALMDQQRVVDIFLNYESTVTILLGWATDDLLDFTDSFDHCDTNTSVRILARLDNPSVLWRPKLSLNLLDGLLIIRVLLTTIVFINADLLAIRCPVSLTFVVLLHCRLDLLLCILVPLFQSIIVIHELVVVGVIDSVLGVERQR